MISLKKINFIRSHLLLDILTRIHLLGLIMWRLLCLGRSAGCEIDFGVNVLQWGEASGSDVCISPGHAMWGRPLLLLADEAGPELNFPQDWRTDYNSTDAECFHCWTEGFPSHLRRQWVPGWLELDSLLICHLPGKEEGQRRGWGSST